MTHDDGISRRRFLATGIAAGVAAGTITPFEALADGRRRRRRGRDRDDRDDHDDHERDGPREFGPIAPVPDASTGLPLLELPAGFEYTSFGWTGDPLERGEPTPSNHDGMGCFRSRRHQLVLVRNHERNTGSPFSPHAPVYDPAAAGGTTSLVFDARRRRVVRMYASLTGTLRNCAGGVTPWGSWITCEETRNGPGDGPLLEEHGFCFEVPVRGTADAQPLRAMGRFSHEAIAFEHDGSAAYLTEDRTNAGLYRFLPNRRRRLSTGRLQMLRVRDAPGADLSRGVTVGEWLAIDWVDIAEPAPAGRRRDVDRNSVFGQGRAQGAARFIRLEGIWAGRRRIYFVSTSGGPARRGQIFELDPRRQRLRLLFESSGAAELDSPDNLAVSPRGGIVLCEDGAGSDRLLALSRHGELSVLARGNVRLAGERGFVGDFSSSELAGACWSRGGRWLFVNVQRPGITLAIRGPWHRGGL
ncbi:MAG: alkaline phosphatase PhoX [Myxococcota bacterium]|nr:alkaline phosphatase PhoX [Myxococcota bacterium]